MVKCDKCSSKAVVRQKYSGMKLCGGHLDEDIHRKVREALRETRAFSHGARIAVAMSGDNSGSALLRALKDIFSRRRDVQFAALIVDEGIEGYSSGRAAWARKIAESMDVPAISLSLRDVFGLSADSVAIPEGQRCSFCRSLKDALLNRAACQWGASALATGESLDDGAGEVFARYLEGDMDGLMKLRPGYTPPGMVARIRPLSKVPAREVGLYARMHGLSPSPPAKCPYEKDPLGIEGALRVFDARHQGTKYSLLKSLQRLSDILPGAKPLSEGGE